MRIHYVHLSISDTHSLWELPQGVATAKVSVAGEICSNSYSVVPHPQHAIGTGQI